MGQGLVQGMLTVPGMSIQWHQYQVVYLCQLGSEQLVLPLLEAGLLQ